MSSEAASDPSKCQNCGSELIPDSLYCHKCGTRVAGKNGASNNQQNIVKPSSDYSSIGLLLIKIGAILAFVLPFATFAGIGGISSNYGRIFGPLDNFFLGAFIAAVVFGIIFGVIALRFHKEIIAGRSERIVHTIILGVAMFVLGSNVAGALVGVGAFLCYISPLINRSKCS